MSRIIAIHSFRGGTGKSNITANLAALAARRGERAGIIDTDIQSPGIHVLFGLDEAKGDWSLNDFLWGDCPIEAAAYDVTAALQSPTGESRPVAGAVFLVPSSLNSADIARVLREGYDVARLGRGFREIIERLDLDHLFIDTHPGLNEETLLSIAIADVLVVILRPDQQDYQGTGVTIDVARTLDVPKILLIVNKALPSVSSEQLRASVAKTYDCEVAGVLPLDEDLVRLASAGVFCVHYPGHPVARRLEEIAERVLGS
jgi:MinD-like ATPase involved in chromosome partitioning or flagellar assembly